MWGIYLWIIVILILCGNMMGWTPVIVMLVLVVVLGFYLGMRGKDF